MTERFQLPAALTTGVGLTPGHRADPEFMKRVPSFYGDYSKAEDRAKERDFWLEMIRREVEDGRTSKEEEVRWAYLLEHDHPRYCPTSISNGDRFAEHYPADLKAIPGRLAGTSLLSQPPGAPWCAGCCVEYKIIYQLLVLPPNPQSWYPEGAVFCGGVRW